MADRKKAKKPKKDDPEQSKRFVETARELGVDESGKSFDKTMDNILEKKKEN